MRMDTLQVINAMSLLEKNTSLLFEYLLKNDEIGQGLLKLYREGWDNFLAKMMAHLERDPTDKIVDQMITDWAENNPDEYQEFIKDLKMSFEK